MNRLLLLPLLLGGCAEVIEPPANQAGLDKIATSCGLPRGSFVLQPDGHVHVRTPQSARYEPLNCAYKKIARTPFRMKLAFIGEGAKRDAESVR